VIVDFVMLRCLQSWKYCFAIEVKRNMKYTSFCPISILLATGIAVPCFSAPVSRVIDYSNYENPLRIELHKGLGTNISFDMVGETIETMFLDNKSFVSLHTNGCIADLSGRNPCPTNSSSTLVHLSVIDNINLAGVINTNREAGNISMLTLVTTDSRKRKRNYVVNIKIVKSPSTTPHVALVRVLPKPIFTYIPSNIAITNSEKIEYLKTGFRLAILRGDYKFNFPKYTNIQRFITALTTGVKLQSAPDYDISLDTISTLVKLGTPAK
jgi:hypothetical protein